MKEKDLKTGKVKQDEPKKTKLSRRAEKILEKLSRTELEQFVHYLSNPWRIMWANFLAGTFRGLGFLIGASLIIAVVGYIITRVLGQVPFVGDMFTAFNLWVQETLEATKGATTMR